MPSLSSALVAEFLGTLILILLGDGVVGSAVLLGKGSDWIIITAGWALAVVIAIYVTRTVSGAHLNPAVTVALATRGSFPWQRVLPYCAAQIAGAAAGALLVYADYGMAFAAFESQHGIVRGAMQGGMLAGPAAGGAGVFCTFPAFAGLTGNLFSEFIGTTLLVLAVLALTDNRNQAPGPDFGPVAVGLVVFAIGLSLGGLTGYAINPARDLGPRLAAAGLGWGWSVFQSHGAYFWVPIVAPLAGGIAGSLVYDATIGRSLSPVTALRRRASDNAAA